VCRACTEIAAGSSLDVFEIDGASNRGINEIRQLRDGVAYAPQRDKYKIYIIDEVHMLTSEAFNALLKTLEEPPRHVKFIFATTEPQKIPVTILSRCQRYDFKRVPLTQVRTHLEGLLQAEEITLPPEGVRMIARESEGSVRDALSLLDRVISFAGDGSDAAAVSECLGIADRDWIISLLRALLDGDTAAALDVVANVHGYGYDMRSFTSEVLTTLRDLIVVKVCGKESKAAELSDSESQELATLGEPVAIAALQRMFQILLTAADKVASSRHPRLALEMALVRCATVRELQAVPEVLARLEALEARLSSGAASPAPARQAPPQEPVQQPRPERRPPQRNTRPPEARPPVQQDAPKMAPPQNQSQPANQGPPAPSAPVKGTQSNTRAQALSEADWPDFVKQTHGTDPLLASMLENAVVIESAPGALVLAVANKFYHSQLSAGRNHDRFSELVTAFTATSTRITVKQDAPPSETIASERKTRISNIEKNRHDTLVNHPITRAVENEMDGKVVDVRVEESHDDE
jgi:DNA polymerase-3 subunit gamma/tau